MRISVNSLSGGKTSSYMAVHYPADYDVFALVCIEDKNCEPKDPYIKRIVSEKLGKDFIATAESDITIKVILDLEQITGRPIKWLSGDTFEKVIRKVTNNKGLPNQMWRFCTTELKMRPIFDWWFENIKEIVDMRIGFRFDEKERAERISNEFKGIVGKSQSGRNKWDTILWRKPSFPLIENKVFHLDVYNWSKSTSLIFPKDSNCVGCFHKDIQQLRKNWDNEPDKMQWFANQENKKKKWKKEMHYESIKKVGLQQDFIFGTGTGCQGGFCTD